MPEITCPTCQRPLDLPPGGDMVMCHCPGCGVMFAHLPTSTTDVQAAAPRPRPVRPQPAAAAVPDIARPTERRVYDRHGRRIYPIDPIVRMSQVGLAFGLVTALSVVPWLSRRGEWPVVFFAVLGHALVCGLHGMIAGQVYKAAGDGSRWRGHLLVGLFLVLAGLAAWRCYDVNGEINYLHLTGITLGGFYAALLLLGVLLLCFGFVRFLFSPPPDEPAPTMPAAPAAPDDTDDELWKLLQEEAGDRPPAG